MCKEITGPVSLLFFKYEFYGVHQILKISTRLYTKENLFILFLKEMFKKPPSESLFLNIFIGLGERVMLWIDGILIKCGLCKVH